MEMSAAADFHFELAIAGRVSGLPVNTSVPWRDRRWIQSHGKAMESLEALSLTCGSLHTAHRHTVASKTARERLRE